MNDMTTASIPGVNRLKFFDVSHWEQNVDWNQAKASGFVGCFSKATDGTAYVDPTFAKDRAAAHSVGMVYGRYHFFRFDDNPLQQAQHAFQTGGAIAANETGLILDLEWDNDSAHIGYHNGGEIDDAGAQKALLFLNEAKALSGMTPIVYTAPGFFPGSAKLETVAKFAEFPLWIAHFGVPSPHVPSPWKSWTWWQYSDSGLVPGTGKIDVSYFAGDLAALKALTKS